MILDRWDFELIRLAGRYQYLSFESLSNFSTVPYKKSVEHLSKIGLVSIARSQTYFFPSPEGYKYLAGLGLRCHQTSKRAYAGSAMLRRKLETAEILYTCRGGELSVLNEELNNSPVFVPAFEYRGRSGNLLNAAVCTGFINMNETLYMCVYVNDQRYGLYYTNELKTLHNLASSVNQKMTALIFAGTSYDQIYAQITSTRETRRNGQVSYAEAYQRSERLKVHLLPCNDTGCCQLYIMKHAGYNTKIARTALKANYKSAPLSLDADAIVDGTPLLIAVDMDIRRVQQFCRDTDHYSHIMIAALEPQMRFLMRLLPKKAKPLKIDDRLIQQTFGAFPQASVTPAEYKGDFVYV